MNSQTMRLGLALLATLSIFVSSQAQELPKNPRIQQALQPFIDDGTVAGIVAVVASTDRVLSQDVMGMAEIEPPRPMRSDSLFWIASMTKPITAACVMQLVDSGKLSLDDPISLHLPEMGKLKTDDDQPATITIGHLLTHTSGMAELPMLSAYSGRTLAEMADKYSRVKLLFSPGTRWQYSQTSINTAARIVEVVSGLSFDQYVDKNICQPLGMIDTTFYLSESQASRLAQAYSKTEDGLKPATIFLIPGVSPTSRDRFPAANGGLFSTASDYVRFCQMLLGQGQWSGTRLLSTSAVAQMRTIATGEMKTGFTEGNGWGIGCCVIAQPQGVTASLSPGSFGHGGAYGTQAWIDPVKSRIYLLLVQRSNFANADASPLRQAFQEAAQTDTSSP